MTEDFDELTRRATNAMRAEADAITNTDRALEELANGDATAVVTALPPKPHRGWWIAGAAAAALIIGIGAVVLVHDDESRRILSTPPTQLEPDPTLPETVPEPTTTVSDTVRQPVEPTPTVATVPTSTTLPADGEGFIPECVETTDVEPQRELLDEHAIDSFSPLAAEPALTIQLPTGLSQYYPDPLAAESFPVRIPGGILLPIRSSSYGSFAGSMVAAVNGDGTKRWVSCDKRSILRVLVAPASDQPSQALAIFLGATGTDGLPTYEQQFISLEDGAEVGTLHDLMASEGIDPNASVADVPLATSDTHVLFGLPQGQVLEATDQMVLLDLVDFTIQQIPVPPALIGTAPPYVDIQFADDGSPVLMGSNGSFLAATSVYRDGAWTSDEQALMSTFGITAEIDFTDNALVGHDALGNVAWRVPEITDPQGEGFRTGESNDVTVVSGCGPSGCGEGYASAALYGVDTATGEVLWKLDGRRSVSAFGDGYALVTDAPIPTTDGTSFDLGPWILIDTSTGKIAGGADQRWTDPATFEQQCCGGADSVHVGRFGGVVVAVHETRVTIWYPKAAGPAPSDPVAIP